MDRRHFLSLSTAALGAMFIPPAMSGQPGWLTGFGAADGAYGLARIGTDLSVTPVLQSPQRLHDVVLHPSRGEICAPLRRPGRRFYVIDAGGIAEARETLQGRHFQGHGAYSADGTTLYLPENDFEGERGMIGIYDALDGYGRLGEVPSGGIGPHAMLRHPDDDHLIIANGGLLTHPESGRAVLNRDTMTPNLSLMARDRGTIVDQLVLASEYHLLSLRHMAVMPDGAVIVGAQDQDSRRRDMPLLIRWVPGREFTFFEAPPDGWGVFKAYMGSVSGDTGGRIVAATSPKGGVAGFWQANSGRFIGLVKARDICGAAATGTPGEFLLTTGTGALHIVTASDTGVKIGRTVISNTRFDNHCERV
ncbi:MAG: DUF1513 domain-containing protein [Magnetospiraceae bacterium]